MGFTLKDLPSREVLEKYAEIFREIDVDSISLLLTFQHIARDMIAVGEKHFASYGISIGKFSVLMLLYRFNFQGGLKPSELAEKAGVTRATVTGLIDGLEKSELVERSTEGVKDRRKMIVRLTEKGIGFLNKILPDHFKKVSILMSGLNPNEKKHLMHYLGKISDGIQDFQRHIKKMENAV